MANRRYKNAPLIHDWEELAKCTSEDYYLVIDLSCCNGSIRRKSDNAYMEYLSTHTFYGTQYYASTVTLQKYGFNVRLDNWDKEV